MKNWFLNLKVKNKLTIAFSLLVVFMVVIGGMGYLNMHSMSKSLDHIASKQIPELDYLLQLDRDMQQSLVAERTLVYTDPNSPMFQDLVNDHDENVEQTMERFQKYKALNDHPESNKMKQDFIEKRAAWMEVSNKIVALCKSGSEEERAEAMRLSLGEGAVRFEAARSIVDKLEELTEHNIAADLEASNASFELSTYELIVGGVLLLIVAVFSSIFLTSLLTKPLEQATVMVKELGKGHLAKRVNPNGKDEINSMLSEMNTFADTLQGFRDTMYKVSEGDLSTDVKLLDKDDELSPALNKIVYTLRDLKKETDYLSSNALDGNLKVRGNVSKFNGGYREIVHGFNNTLEAIVVPINAGVEVLKVMAEGDLVSKMEGEYKGDHKIIKNSINGLQESLHQMVRQVYDSVNATASASAQISASTEEMSAGSQEQSAQTNEIASAVEQMTSTIIETTSNVNIAAEKSKEAGKIASTGGSVVNETIEGMNRIARAVNEASEIISALGASSHQIGQIIQVINDIADQTNLLALNAAIEAARAGEQGRGFAVVADEVRKLAERTSKATGEIAGMIKQIQRDTSKAVDSIQSGTTEVENGKELATKAGASLHEIIASTDDVVKVISQVAMASEQQSVTAEEISRNIEGISSVTNETATGIMQMARASEDLNRMTENLQELIARFRLDDSTYHQENGKARLHGNARALLHN